MIDLKALRAKFIDLAIRGKLVEQRPEEGTAEELYNQIQEEKARLVKEKKLKKEKPLAPVTDEEILFEIPETWKWCRLSSLVFNHGQKTPDKEFAYIEINSIDNSIQKIVNLNIVQASNAPSRARKIVHEGDILYATVRPYLHNICIVGAKSEYEQIASTGFAVLSCFNGLLNKYLFYVLLSSYFDSYANSPENSKGVSYPAINDECFYKALIPLPPLSEQKRIVEKLKAVLSVIDKAEELLERKRALNKKIMEKILQMAISGRLVEQRPEEGTAEELYTQIQEEKTSLIKEKKLKKEKPLAPVTDEEIPFEIPESWKWEKVGNIILFDVGGGTPDKSNPNFWKGKIPWMSVKDFVNVKNNVLADTQDHITELGLVNSSSKLIDTQAIILCTRMGLGKFTKISQPTAINQDLRAIWLSKNIEEKFFLYFYSAVSIKGTGTTVEGIRKQQLFNMLIPIPPLSEQKRIVAKIEELFALCDDLK